MGDHNGPRRDPTQPDETSPLRGRLDIGEVLESVSDAFFALDSDWRFIYLNSAAERLVARSREELLGNSVWDEFPEAVGSAFDREYHRAVNEKVTVELEEYYPPLNAWFAVRAYPTNDGLAVYFRNVTERRERDQALRESEERLKSLSHQMLENQERDRRHLAGELHDELGQTLTAISLHLKRIAGKGDLSLLGDVINIVDQAIEQVRGMALDLRPSMLDHLGLESTLRWYANRLNRQTGLPVSLDTDLGDERLSADIETACFRVAQEALTNVVRHAQANRAGVVVRRQGDRAELTVWDDGVGFCPEPAQRNAAEGGSFGLLGMRERVQLAGGAFTIQSSPGRGTSVHARFSLETQGAVLS